MTTRAPGDVEEPVSQPRSKPSTGTVGLGMLATVPALLTLYFAFSSGGFFAGAPATAAVVLGLVLVLRITLADDPSAGLTRPLAVAAAGLGLFAAWVLASAFWSDATARVVVEFDRAIMYWLVVVVLASVPWSPAWLSRAVRAVTVAIVVVAGAGLVSRILPEVLPTTTLVQNSRLGYPLSYWNALGILCGLGVVLCVHLSSSLREPLVSRVLAAAALPVVAGALFFSFSRGGMVAAVAGIGIYVVLARPIGFPAALLAAGPAVAVTVMAAYGADLLAGDNPQSAGAVAQGQDVALVVGGCVVVAAVLRLALGRLDRALPSMLPSVRRPSAVTAAIAAALVLVVGVLAAAAGGGSWIADRYDNLVAADANESGDLRGRFSSVDNNGRIEQWRVAVDAFQSEPLTGEGAASFRQAWALERDGLMKVEDAHSLYLETLAELGAIGLTLLLVPLAVFLVGTALRSRGPNREVQAAIFACLTLWALHAGIDWDWEMPAVTAWVLALGAMALATRDGPRVAGPVLGRLPRVVLGVGILALIALPALMAVSQQRLDESVAAFKREDCDKAIEAALGSARAMPVRPEPFALLGYCDARLGKPDLAVEMLEAAVERDPGDWQLHYGLALVRATAGRDPRSAARTALRLNPNEPLARNAVSWFRGTNPRVWQRRASSAPLPIL